MEERRYGGGGRGRVYTYRYTVTTRVTCIKMGSYESHFNVSLVVRDKVKRQCPQTTTFEELESRSGIEPRSLRLPAYRVTARPNRLSKFGKNEPRPIYDTIHSISKLNLCQCQCAKRVHKFPYAINESIMICFLMCNVTLVARHRLGFQASE